MRNGFVLALRSAHLPSADRTLDCSVVSDETSIVNWTNTGETGSSDAESPVLSRGFPFQGILLSAAGLIFVWLLNRNLTLYAIGRALYGILFLFN